MRIDTSFDFRADACGKDPDAFSPTLRRYHRILWSRPLPCGRSFDLTDRKRGAYLYHQSELGEFFLSSDTIVPTFTSWKRMKPVIDLLPEEENERFRAVGYTIGGTIIFPANRADGKHTINVTRGFNRKICDRFDLTLECIRRFYSRQNSPLTDVLNRYSYFFSLFYNFEGYVNFFFLQDLVSSGGATIEFLLPFDDFSTPPTPGSLEEYLQYRHRSMGFIQARNRRIELAYAKHAC